MTGVWLAAGGVSGLLGTAGTLLVSRLSGLLVCSIAVSIITPVLYALFQVLHAGIAPAGILDTIYMGKPW